MKRFVKKLCMALLCWCLLTAGAYPASLTQSPNRSQTKKETLTNASVIDLVKLGLSDAIIIEKIRQSDHNFDTSIEGLRQLKAARVSDAIIKEMLSPQMATVAPLASSAPSAGDGASVKPTVARDSAGNTLPLPPDKGVYLWDGKKMHLLQRNDATSTGQNVWRSITPFVKKKIELQMKQAYAKVQFDHNQPTILVSGLGEVIPGVPSFRMLYVKTGGMMKDRRIIGTYDVGGFFGSTERVDSEIECQISKVADGIYAFTPKTPLKDGEYGLVQSSVAAASPLIWDFGIYVEGRPEQKKK